MHFLYIYGDCDDTEEKLRVLFLTFVYGALLLNLGNVVIIKIYLFYYFYYFK